MDLPFGVSQLCVLLLWGCTCFPSQNGYNAAHGYSLSENPQTSNQFDSGAFINTNHEDDMQAMGHQSLHLAQSEPVHYENGEDFGSVASPGEETVQPDSGQEQDEPPVQKNKYLSSGYQHPFGILTKEHTTQETAEGVTFPTIKDFQRFVETMKSSFLMPGSDLTRHFQTARETMEKELTLSSQNVKSSTGSESVKEGSDHDDDDGKNEVWSEPMNTVFEQGEQDAHDQKPSESLSFTDPVDSTASLISPTVYERHGSALFPRHNLAATEHVSSHYGGGISGEHPGIFTSAPNVQKDGLLSTSYTPSEQVPSGSFSGGDFTFSGHATAPPFNPSHSPSQDLSYYSSKIAKPRTLNLSPHSGDSLRQYQKPSDGFELDEDFHVNELLRVNEADVLSPRMPAPLNSYGKSIYVSAPRGQHYIPDNLQKHRERPASVLIYEPAAGKESKDAPAEHLPAFTVSMSSDLSPQSGDGHVGVEKSRPRDPQRQVASSSRSRQPVTVEPSSSLRDSSRHGGAPRPSILTAQAGDEEDSDLPKLNLVSAIQEPRQKNVSAPRPTLTQSGISSQVSGDHAGLNSPTNLAPTSEPKKALLRLLGKELMSRNFKNIISKFLMGARNLPGLYSSQRRQGISLKNGFLGATRAGPRQTLIQPTKVRKRPANVNKESGDMTYRPPEPLSASKVSGATLHGVFDRNGGNRKSLPLQKGPSTLPPSVSAYLAKSRSSYVKGKVSVSNTRYTPYQHAEGKTPVEQRKPAPKQQKPPLYPTK